ncbi:hypothetical protein GDO86_005173 [Hymenochirus boettgeri]|uniref:Gem-associated protein 5 n=1 Tax=Hymenochirus boettgeri TaxID=247094 RepID=A0A8T2J6E3_9PIPI|nr:hypothetical protein GDO86_005173 [Hymenochirus boettgeri]
MGGPDRMLSASPNWYCSRASDAAGSLFGFAARNCICLLHINPQEPGLYGELAGHTDRVSSFAFSHFSGQTHLCASSSDDGTVKVWDTQTKSIVTEHKLHRSTISALHWSPAVKDLLVSGDEKGILVCFWYNRNDSQQFFPEPRTIFCLSCSPHKEDIVAVGYKDGMIVLIDISRRGEVVHRLRGHEDEIHCLEWCPHPQEREQKQDEDTEEEINKTNGEFLSEPENNRFYLASGSKDQTIRIWCTSTGKGVTTLKMPYLKRRGGGVDSGVKERLWLTVHWPQGRPTQILSSCFGGELLLWDLAKSGKQKWTLLGTSDGQNHSRIVFNLCSLVTEEGSELLLSTSMDREVKCWDLSSLSCCWSLASLGGFVYSLAFSPVATGCLAVGVGDSMIRVWNTLSVVNAYDVKTLWQGIRSKVTALAWHPTKETSLAFGTEDGKVGIFEVFLSKPPQISSTYHKKTVYSLCWGPPLPPVSFGADGDRPPYSLYSCGGEGIIYQHNPWKLNAESCDINKLIRDTNNIKHKLPVHTELSWRHDLQHLAVGNEDGTIEVFRAPGLQLICTIQQHHKLVNALRWHHNHSQDPDMSFLLASGSNNAAVFVHNLKGPLESLSDAPLTITEPYRNLLGHTAKITSLSWSPHHDARLVSASYDGTAQVWDVLQEEPLSNYRGHKGRLLSIHWSPVELDQVWTGADDFCLHNWSVSKQQHSRPPKEKKRNLQPKLKPKKKKKMEPSKQEMTAGDLPGGEDDRHGALQNGMSDQEEEQAAPPQEPVDRVTLEVILPEPAQTHCQPTSPTMPAVEKSSPSIFNKSGPVRKDQTKDRSDLHSKKKKARSLLPISTGKDHLSKEEQHRDCVKLVTAICAKDVQEGPQAHSEDSMHLGLYRDRAALYRLMEEEGKAHLESGHPELQHEIMLWKGDLKGTLQLAVERGELTDQLVALSPMAGYKVWLWTVESFVKQLCFQEQYVKAASHLLSINKVYEAVQLLLGNHLYREAIALAKARLPASDPIHRELYTSWAAVLEKDGHYALAAKCYLGSSSPYDAAKVLAKKGDLPSLRTAAEVALIAGEKDLAASFAIRCAQELVEAKNFVGASEALQRHHSLLGQRLVFCTSELLYTHLEDKMPVDWGPQIPPNFHEWEDTGRKESFITKVISLWQRECGVGSMDLFTEAYKQLSASEIPPTTVNTNPKQLLLQLAHEITMSSLSHQLENWLEAALPLLRILSRCHQAGHFTLMQEISRLLFPNGCEDLKAMVSPENIEKRESGTACDNVGAFLAYIRMYELWWEGSEQPTVYKQTGTEVNTDCLHEETGDVMEAEQNTTPGLCDFEVLLSELHAAYQSAQREIAEVQAALREMIQLHQRTRQNQDSSLELEQEPELNLSPSQDKSFNAETNVSAGPSPVSLAELMKKLSAVNHKLAEFPEFLKALPFPDVMESCLVLLHFPPALLPPVIRAKALALLLSHSSGSADHRKAAKKFLPSPE